MSKEITYPLPSKMPDYPNRRSGYTAWEFRADLTHRGDTPEEWKRYGLGDSGEGPWHSAMRNALLNGRLSIQDALDYERDSELVEYGGFLMDKHRKQLKRIMAGERVPAESHIERHETGSVLKQLYPDAPNELLAFVEQMFTSLSEICSPVFHPNRYAVLRGGCARELVMPSPVGKEIPEVVRSILHLLQEKPDIAQPHIVQGFADASQPVLDLDVGILPVKKYGYAAREHVLYSPEEVASHLTTAASHNTSCILECRPEEIRTSNGILCRITGSFVHRESGFVIPLDIVYLPTDAMFNKGGMRFGTVANFWDQSVALGMHVHRAADGTIGNHMRLDTNLRGLFTMDCVAQWSDLKNPDISLTDAALSSIRAIANELIHKVISLPGKTQQAVLANYASKLRCYGQKNTLIHLTHQRESKIDCRHDCFVKEMLKLTTAMPDVALQLLGLSGLLPLLSIYDHPAANFNALGIPLFDVEHHQIDLSQYSVDRHEFMDQQRIVNFIEKFTIIDYSDPQHPHEIPYSQEAYLQLLSSGTMRPENTGIGIIGRACGIAFNPITGVTPETVLDWLSLVLPRDEKSTKSFSRIKSVDSVAQKS